MNKPSGLAVQGGTNTSRHVDGMLEALRFELNEKPKLVHRIDKDTSGVLVLARNRTWADRLTKAFREHTLPKTYLALVNSCPKIRPGRLRLRWKNVAKRVWSARTASRQQRSIKRWMRWAASLLWLRLRL